MKLPNIVAWQGIEIALPGNWEMVRYGRLRPAGVCAFMDEFRERVHLAWQRGVDRPELGRLLANFTARERAPAAEGGQPAPAPEYRPLAAPHGWQGVVAVCDGLITTRAARYFEAERTLVELAVFWECARDGVAEEAILSSVRAFPESGLWRWRACGLDVDVPSGMSLSACVCLPGDTQWTFSARKALPAISFHRMAFPSLWLKQPLGEWLKTKLPPRSRKQNCETMATAAGHELVCCETTRSRGRFGRFAGKRIFRRDYACLCPVERRVLHVAVDREQSSGVAVRLRCECGDVLPAASSIES